MTTLTNDEIQHNISNAIVAIESPYQQLSSKIPTIHDDIQTPFGGSGSLGDRFYNTMNSFIAQRATLSQGIDLDNLRTHLIPQLSEISEFLGLKPNLTELEIVKEYKQYMADNSLTVEARAFSFGSPSADGGNVGDGQILRLTKDKFGNDVEAGHVEAKTFRIIQDQTSNPQLRHNELGVFEGQPEPFDNFGRLGMTRSGDIGVSEVNVVPEEGGLLFNTSFSSATGSGASLFSSWTLSGAGAGVTQNTTTYFRADPGTSTPASLEATAPVTITQSLTLTNIDPEKAYMLCLRYNREDGAGGAAPAGTAFDIKMGTTTKTFTLAGTETGWNLASLDLDETLYGENWAEDEAKIIIDITTLASGSLLIDSVILYEMDVVDATPYIVLGGQTPFSATNGAVASGVGDLFSWTDSLSGSDSIIQRFFALLYRISLPPSATPTWADPTLP